MILQAIEYEGFRNLINSRLTFCNTLNVITGNNGAGKTNLLEAIFFAAYCTSFRTNDDRNMVKFNEPYMRVTAISEDTTATVFYNGTKRMVINGNEKSRLSEYIGWLPCVVMSFNDIWMIKGAPAKRRNFLDWLLIKIYPAYGSHLTEYRKILRQRNTILQQKKYHASLLQVYNDQFIQHGNLIYAHRRKIVPILKEKIGIVSKDLGLDGISFEYLSSCPDMMITSNDLKKVEPLEIQRGETIIGPHRDDFTINIGGRPAKQYASQGECRILALLLKLIEREVIRQKMNQEPIYLIDEATLELDHFRRKRFFELIEGQIFFATVQEFDELNFRNKKRFVIKEGLIAVS
ncbi:MAG: DNA replication and repair protein RecF [candidate division WOR-3 bacterium]|nr:DNA replication and repair protein RecF [candidate division WOR-3 bacterium]